MWSVVVINKQLFGNCLKTDSLNFGVSSELVISQQL